MSYAKLAAFVLALGVGLGASELAGWLATPKILEPVSTASGKSELPEKIADPVQPIDQRVGGCDSGTGIGAGSGSSSGSKSKFSTSWSDSPQPASSRVVSPLKILFKKKAQYTEAARINSVQGAVTLRVTFLASGCIGSITTVRGLPYGLTEQAIIAAREIKFEPEKVNGVPRTTTRPVSFTFNIY